MSFPRSASRAHLNAGRTNKKLGVETLERRDLMAVGDHLLHMRVADAAAVCGPLPLETAEIATATSPPSAAEATPDVSNYGNITAEVIDRVLFIRGDAGGNRFRIASREVTGEVYIRPISTTINGRVVDYQETFQNITRIDIDLGDGDDLVVIDDTRVVGMTIVTGAGNDEVSLRGPMPSLAAVGMYIHIPQPAQPLIVDGDLVIDTGDGDDQLTPFATVKGDATIRMGAGDDSFFEVMQPNNQITFEPAFVQPLVPPVLGELKATGVRSVDLGSGQDVENIPDDYRSDPDLVRIMHDVQDKLDLYQGMIERSEATPGTPQLVLPPAPELAARVDAEGRLEIEFGFLPAYRRAVERLVKRGVIVDAYSVVRGSGRASIREEDLRLFANLPGLTYLRTRPYLRPELESTDSFNLRWNPGWDFVRAGSATADDIAAQEGPQPVAGPPQLEDLPVRAPGEEGSLLESRYGTRILGPQPLQ
jgi:hypothetical protein